MNELQQLKKEIEELQNWKKQLETSHSIPLNVDQAFRARLSNLVNTITVSTKGVDTEDVTVDENGVAIYSVMNDPDGFLQVTVGGAVYYLPYFT